MNTGKIMGALSYSINNRHTMISLYVTSGLPELADEIIEVMEGLVEAENEIVQIAEKQCSDDKVDLFNAKQELKEALHEEKIRSYKTSRCVSNEDFHIWARGKTISCFGFKKLKPTLFYRNSFTCGFNSPVYPMHPIWRIVE